LKHFNKRITVGIIGVGRFGQAIAHRLPPNINLLLADKLSHRASKLASELSAKSKTVRETFLKSDVVLLVVPPSEVCSLVEKYSMIMKSKTVLVNMATSVKTDKVQKKLKRKDIKVIGAKAVGQAYAISKGSRAFFILSASDPYLVIMLKFLFGSIGKVVIGDEMLADKINAEATRFGLRLAIDLRKQLEKICSSKEIIDVAIKTVAVGTAQDYLPNESNEYIEKRLNEL